MRKESLDKDRADDGVFRGAFNQEEKDLFHQEFNSNVPFFFNAWGSEIDLVGQYKGASAFLICNGPSLSSGKYDVSLLKKPGVITMGINNGPRTIRPNLWTCVDDPKRFIKSIWFDPCIQKFVPLSFATKALFDNENWCDMLDEKGSPYVVRKCPNMVYFRRNTKFMAERYLVEDTVNWGNSAKNGGSRTVMLSALRLLYLLGFRKIYLLGADFDMSGEKTYHFDEQRDKGAVNGNMSTYEALKTHYFPSLKPYFEKAGYHVYNCNLESKLKVFDFVRYEDAIEEATYKLGNIKNERTWGLYSKPEERQKWINEPPEQAKGHLKTIENRPDVPVYADNVQIHKVETPIHPPTTHATPVESLPPPQFREINNESPIFKAPSVPKPIQVSFKPFTQQQNGQALKVELPRIEGCLEKNDKKDGKIIRSLPCDSLSFGTSGNDKNVTIEDNGM